MSSDPKPVGGPWHKAARGEVLSPPRARARKRSCLSCSRHQCRTRVPCSNLVSPHRAPIRPCRNRDCRPPIRPFPNLYLIFALVRQAASAIALVRVVVAAGQVGLSCAGAADGRRGGRRQVVAVVGRGGVRGQVPGHRLRREAARHRAGHLHFVHAGRVAGRVGGVAEAKAFRLLARRGEAGVTRRQRSKQRPALCLERRFEFNLRRCLREVDDLRTLRK